MNIQSLKKTLFDYLPVLAILGAACFVWFDVIVTGDPRIRVNPDSDTYLWFDFSSLTTMLLSIRTLGYPVMLRFFWEITDNIDYLPYFQLALFLLAGLIYFSAISLFTGSKWLGALASMPVYFSPFVVDYFNIVSGDIVGCALMICTISMLILSAGKFRIIWLFLLTIFLLMTYQVRPVYLFLIPLVPILYLVLSYVKHGAEGIFGKFSVVIGVCIVPFLAFCLLRLIVVGHFGLVSFGGYNVVGITASMIRPELIEQLDGVNKEIAEDIFLERSSRGYRSVQEKMAVQDPDLFEQWEKEYAVNIYTIAVPIMRARILPEQDERGSAKVVNELMMGLSREILLLEPYSYARWLVHQFFTAVKTAFVSSTFSLWAGCIALLALIARLVVMRRFVLAKFPRRYHVAAIVGSGMFLAGTLLVILVEPALDRYIHPVGIFVPGLLCVYAVFLFTGYPALWASRTRRQPAKKSSYDTDTAV